MAGRGERRGGGGGSYQLGIKYFDALESVKPPHPPGSGIFVSFCVLLTPVWSVK